LNDLNERLKGQNITLAATAAAKNAILESGYDAEMGARSLKRWVERCITTEISRMIIAQTIPPQSQVVVNVGAW